MTLFSPFLQGLVLS